MHNFEPLAVQARRLSSGTIANLTNLKRYDEIDPLRERFVEYCEALPVKPKTWVEAWNNWTKYGELFKLTL